MEYNTGIERKGNDKCLNLRAQAIIDPSLVTSKLSQNEYKNNERMGIDSERSD